MLAEANAKIAENKWQIEQYEVDKKVWKNYSKDVRDQLRKYEEEKQHQQKMLEEMWTQIQ